MTRRVIRKVGLIYGGPRRVASDKPPIERPSAREVKRNRCAMAIDLSEAWYVDRRPTRPAAAGPRQRRPGPEVFESMLARLGDAPSYGRAVILGRLGRCFHVGERPALAVRQMREAIDVIGRLVPSEGVKRLRGALRSDLGDALRACGQYGEARKAHEAALKIAEELDDQRGRGVELARLGALALDRGETRRGAGAPSRGAAAVSDRSTSRTWKRRPGISSARSITNSGEWDAAERHYREAARLTEASGHLNASCADLESACRRARHEAGRLEARKPGTERRSRSIVGSEIRRSSHSA